MQWNTNVSVTLFRRLPTLFHLRHKGFWSDLSDEPSGAEAMPRWIQLLHLRRQVPTER